MGKRPTRILRIEIGTEYMIRVRIFFVAITLLIVLHTTAFPFVDQYFDQYGKITWTQEKQRLLQFEDYLLRQESMIGYIGYNYSSVRDRRDMRKRARRAFQFLRARRRIKRDRLFIVEGSQRSFSITMLAPVLKGGPPPTFGR
jgi:hypothetical protein